MGRGFHIKSIAPLVAILTAAGVAGFFLLNYALPLHYFAWYPVIPAGFVALCLLSSAFMGWFDRLKPGREAAVLLAAHGVTMLLLAAGLLLYFLLVGQQAVAFGMTVFIFFVIYRTAEIWLYFNFEKKRKEAAGS